MSNDIKKLDINGTEGIWIFLLFDMIVFSLIFIVFLIERSQYTGLFEGSQAQLNILLGTVNTIALLCSSYFVAEAVHAAAYNKPTQTRQNLFFALAMGGVFCTLKAFEYWQKWQSGIDIISNPFFTFYFVITFAHLLHVIVGMLFLSLCTPPKRATNVPINRARILFCFGLFWHYVDILWIFIFPLLYLL